MLNKCPSCGSEFEAVVNNDKIECPNCSYTFSFNDDFTKNDEIINKIKEKCYPLDQNSDIRPKEIINYFTIATNDEKNINIKADLTYKVSQFLLNLSYDLIAFSTTNLLRLDELKEKLENLNDKTTYNNVTMVDRYYIDKQCELVKRAVEIFLSVPKRLISSKDDLYEIALNILNAHKVNTEALKTRLAVYHFVLSDKVTDLRKEQLLKLYVQKNSITQSNNQNKIVKKEPLDIQGLAFSITSLSLCFVNYTILIIYTSIVSNRIVNMYIAIFSFLIIGILQVIFASLGLKKMKRLRGIANAGKITGIIEIVFGVLLLLITI